MTGFFSIYASRAGRDRVSRMNLKALFSNKTERSCMKNILMVIGLACAQAGFGISPALAGAIETNASAKRIGVYDSRIVAFAHFWSAENQAKQREQIKTAQTAKASGDTARFNELSKAISEGQKKSHRQVFGTAPADE